MIRTVSLLFISLIITFAIGCGGGGGGTSTNTPPTASFEVSPSVGSLATSFAVNASACTDAETGNSSLQVRWDWENDGIWDTSYSTSKSLSHQYTSLGLKTIKLQVQDAGGLTGVTTRQIVVGDNTPPVASFSVTPLVGLINTTFQFDASTSYDSEDYSGLLEVRWDWENNGVWDTTFSTTKVTSHQFSSIGNKTIKCEVRDSGGLTSSYSQEIEIANAVSAFGSAVYTPGTPLSVTISVAPPQLTTYYAVEDTPPLGWSVSNIGSGGIYDSVNNKIKWGPFTDSLARTLTYTTTSPIGENGEKVFSGAISIGGTDYEICGGRSINTE